MFTKIEAPSCSMFWVQSFIGPFKDTFFLIICVSAKKLYLRNMDHSETPNLMVCLGLELMMYW